VLGRLIELGMRQSDGWQSLADFADKATVPNRTLYAYRTRRESPRQRHHSTIKQVLEKCAACRGQLAELDEAYRGRGQPERVDARPMRLILEQDEDRSEFAKREFASAYLVASSQDAHAREADGVLCARLQVFINKDDTGKYCLASVRFLMSLPPRSSAREVLGRAGPQRCEDGVTIRHCGSSPRLLAWEIEPEAADTTLENRNAYTQSPYLIEVDGLRIGQVIESRLFAAPKNFKPVARPMGGEGDPELPPEKAKIIEALRLNAELQRRADDGTVVLVDLIDVVQEARK
jgi:hypothetical protein